MVHKWIQDTENTGTCVYCDCTIHYWTELKLGEYKIWSYVLDGNTQYNPFNHKCNSKYGSGQ